MTFDLQRIVEAKRAHRRELAARPIVEKLAMLDVMRERALVNLLSFQKDRTNMGHRGRRNRDHDR